MNNEEIKRIIEGIEAPLHRFEITHLSEGEEKKLICHTSNFRQAKTAAETCSLKWSSIKDLDTGMTRDRESFKC